MAAISIDDLKDLLTGDRKHTVVPDFDGSVGGDRLEAVREKARTAGEFTGDTFSGRRSGHSNIAPDLESYQGLKDDIAELTRDGTKVDGLQKFADKQRDEIAKKAKRVFSDLGESSERHNAALEAITARRAKVEEELQKRYTKELDGLTKKLNAKGISAGDAAAIKDKITNLRENFSEVKDKVRTHFDDLAEGHREHVVRVKELAADIEKETGVSAAEHMSRKAVAVAGTDVAKAEKGIVGEAAYNAKGFFGKRAAEAGANWKGAGGFGKILRVAGTGVGVIIGLKGLKDVGRFVGIVSPEVGEDGKERPADAGNLIKGVGELGVGAAAAYASLCMGGKGKAIGH